MEKKPGSSKFFLRSRIRCYALVSLLMVSACSSGPKKSGSLLGGSDWHEFQGTWTSAGSRNILPFGENRQASIASFNGSLVLSGSSRLGVGFRANAIALNDSATGMVGRAVWTDEHGDQVFSELRGEGTATANKIVGTFVGGTGRYSGATGSYEFSWRFVLVTEDGTVQGQSENLKGRIRVGVPPATSLGGGPQS